MNRISRILCAGAILLLAGIMLVTWHAFHKTTSFAKAAKSSNRPAVSGAAHLKSSGSKPATGVAAIPLPSPSASDAELLQWARKVATLSPEDAVALAQSQPDAPYRRRLLLALSEAWGEVFPAAAMRWAMEQPGKNQQHFIEAALKGAMRTQRSTALVIAQNLLQQRPDIGGTCVGSLICGYTTQSDFAAAAQLADAAPDDFRTNWLDAVYRSWAASQPSDAMQGLKAIPDGPLRSRAFHSAADGWASSDPAGLAAYAQALPSGSERRYAFGQAVKNWSLQDPEAMAAWLKTLPPGSEHDAAATWLIERTDSANRSPQTAMQWVQAISNQRLKQKALLAVLDQWKQTDPQAASKYAANASWISSNERSEILKTLNGTN